MVKKETFVLVSLEEDKAKELAQVISSDACRKILDHLEKDKATESEIAAALNMPISTVHYNIKNLLQSKLIEANEYHYSQKGKEVLHYSLANKFVIIAPKGASESFKNKLKSLLPVVGIVGALSFAVQYLPSLLGGFGKASIQSSDMMLRESAPVIEEMAKLGADAAVDSFAATAPQAAQETANQAAQYAVQSSAQQPIGLWFAFGAASFLLIYLLFDYYRKRKQ